MPVIFSADDGVLLVGHGAGALLALAEALLHLVHVGALEVADLHGHLLEGGAEQWRPPAASWRGGRAARSGSRPGPPAGRGGAWSPPPPRDPGGRWCPRRRRSGRSRSPAGPGPGGAGPARGPTSRPAASGRRWWARRGCRGCGRSSPCPGARGRACSTVSSSATRAARSTAPASRICRAKAGVQQVAAGHALVHEAAGRARRARPCWSGRRSRRAAPSSRSPGPGRCRSRPLARISRAASAGISPRSARTSQTTVSTSCQMRKRFSSDQMAVICGDA